MSLRASRKDLRVRRSLYWANQGLIYAVNALGALCQEPGLPRARLRLARALIEETRVMMNNEMAKWTKQKTSRPIDTDKHR